MSNNEFEKTLNFMKNEQEQLDRELETKADELNKINPEDLPEIKPRIIAEEMPIGNKNFRNKEILAKAVLEYLTIMRGPKEQVKNFEGL